MNSTPNSTPAPPRRETREKGASTTFVIVRHGQTVWNSQGRWQGWLDSPLTELGRRQAEEAREALQEIGIDLAYSSDSGRAVETARLILQDRPDVPLHVAPQLRERSYGGYEGLNTAEIDERYPGTRFDPARGTREDWRAPGEDGETLHDVRTRVQPFLKQLAGQHPGATVLLVTHSNVVRIIDGLSTGEALDDIWHRVPPNACIFIVRGWSDGSLEVVQHFCTG